MDKIFREEPAAGSKAVWLGALLASVAIHVSLMALALSWKAPLPDKPRRVVPVEAITLAEARPGPTGGQGLPAPAAPEVSPRPKPAPKPVPPPKPKPKPRPAKLKPKPTKTVKKPVKREAAEPPPSLALPTPASPAASPPASGRTTASLGRSSGSTRGSGGSGGGPGKGSGSGSGVGRGSGSGSGGGSQLQSYLREVRRLLERQKGYPRMAQRLNIQGVVLLRFTIAADGSIHSTRLRRSSGHGVLDDAARKTVSKVGRFPPLPGSLGRKKLAVEIPLAFRLRN